MTGIVFLWFEKLSSGKCWHAQNIFTSRTILKGILAQFHLKAAVCERVDITQHIYATHAHVEQLLPLLLLRYVIALHAQVLFALILRTVDGL